jgi:hypothetical protein
MNQDPFASIRSVTWVNSIGAGFIPQNGTPHDPFHRNADNSPPSGKVKDSLPAVCAVRAKSYLQSSALEMYSHGAAKLSRR